MSGCELLAHTGAVASLVTPVHPNARRKDWRFKISERDDAMSRPTPVTENSYNAKRLPGTRKAILGTSRSAIPLSSDDVSFEYFEPREVIFQKDAKMRSSNPGGKSRIS